MPTLTRSNEDKTKVKINGTLAFQAANGEGDSILEEVIKFSKDLPYVVPSKLTYIKDSKCWTNQKGKVVIFNIAEEPTIAAKLIVDYLNGENAKEAKKDVTVVGGVITTDTGTPLALDKKTTADKNTALKVDKDKK